MVLHVEIEYHGKKYHVDPDHYVLVQCMKNFERELENYLQALETLEEDIDGTLLVEGKEGVFERILAKFHHQYRFLLKELLNYWTKDAKGGEFVNSLMSLLKPQ